MTRLSTPRTAWFAKKALTVYAYLFPRHWFRREQRRYPQTMGLLPGYTLSLGLLPHFVLRWINPLPPGELDLKEPESYGPVTRRGFRLFMRVYLWLTSPWYWGWAEKLYEGACGRLVGHEISKTEHGYGGGRHVDHLCRWCCKLFAIPIEESIWAEENADLLSMVGKAHERPDGSCCL